jgi:hypothetical protein
MKIYLDRPAIDWLTLTSYDGALARQGTALLLAIGNDPFPRKVIVYDGLAADCEDGGAFVGVGEQMGKYHAMLQLSGGLADKHGPALIAGHEVGENGNCSRVDLQITCSGKIDLDQLAGDLTGRYRGQVTIYKTLQGGQVGDTLYLGSPKSDKRIRIYHKAGGTRFECQYRRDYALSVFMALRNGGGKTVRQVIAGFLLHEVGKVSDSIPSNPALNDITKSLQTWTGGAIIPTSNTRAIGNTERWLRKTVMGVLLRECESNPDFKRELLARIYKCSPNTGEIK